MPPYNLFPFLTPGINPNAVEEEARRRRMLGRPAPLGRDQSFRYGRDDAPPAPITLIGKGADPPLDGVTRPPSFSRLAIFA